MPDSPLAFVRKMETAAARLSRTPSRGVFGAALATKKIMLHELEAAGVKGGRLRGVGTKGTRVGVSFNVRGTRNATALIRATGPWQLVESNTKPHVIQPRRRRAVVVAGQPVARVQHPGTRGRHPWAKGVAASVPVIRKEFESGVSLALRETFGGVL